jgi:hypothetical protein
MADATPVQHVLLASLVGLGLLALHWGTTAAEGRWTRLSQIAAVERAIPPPTDLKDQARWLLTHRRTRLQRLSGLVLLGLLIGGAEGWAWRRRDVLRGVRLRGWTIGVFSAAACPGLVGVLLLAPVPWSVCVVGGVACLWVGVTSALLVGGRPYVA